MEASPHTLYLCPSSPQEVQDRFRVRTEHRVTCRVEGICYCSPTSCHKPLISRALLFAVLSKVYLEMNKTPSPHDGSTPSHRCLSTLLRGHSAPETPASLLFPGTPGTLLPQYLILGVPLPRKPLPKSLLLSPPPGLCARKVFPDHPIPNTTPSPASPTP